MRTFDEVSAVCDANAVLRGDEEWRCETYILPAWRDDASDERERGPRALYSMHCHLRKSEPETRLRASARGRLGRWHLRRETCVNAYYKRKGTSANVFTSTLAQSATGEFETD